MAGLVHGAVGLVSKQAAPKIHLGLFLLCSYWLDILAVLFDAIGLDNSANAVSTHSLVMALIWSVFVGVAIWIWKKDRRVAVILGLVVFSHWVVDLISWPMTGVVEHINTGVPILLSEEPNFGLGLWRNAVVAYICEFGSIAVGLWIYFRARRIARSVDQS